MSTATTNPRPPVLVSADDGPHFHFLNHRATVRVGREATDARLTAVEFTAPRGFGPPLHAHREEDELLYVLEGEIRCRAGDTDGVASAGSIVVLPRGVAHTFQVQSESARFLTVTAGSSSEPSFDQFVMALGTEIPSIEVPPPTEIDPGHVAATCAAHGIDVLGPPPAPLP